MQAAVLAGLCAGLAACAGKAERTSTVPAENFTVVAKRAARSVPSPELPDLVAKPRTVAEALVAAEPVAVAEPLVVAEPQPARKAGGRYTVGKPYWMAGSWYTPQEDPSYDRTGTASWYGPRFHGRLTANGEIFDRRALTAAHPTLPLPSYVRVTNLNNDRSIIVRVNDRGPFRHKRLIDLSERTAELLHLKRAGRAPVRVQYLGKAPVEGGDEAYLAASLTAPGMEPQIQLASAEPSRAAKRRESNDAATLAANDSAAAVAFASETDAGSAAPRVEQAVAVLTASYDPQARIVMAFQSAGMTTE